MNAVFQALQVAENLADRHGDPNWFKNDYTMLRENYGILFSIKGALENQGLWENFAAQCERGWFQRTYG